MENEVLKVSSIEKYYGNKSNITKAINNISFTVEEGEFIGVMGASGSGKTTLLNCISTIDKVTSGHIYVEGLDITKLKGNNLNKFRREELGFIFQDFNLLDTLTAYENIALALSIQNISQKEIDKRIRKVADELDIKEVLMKYPYQMSGGQKQRLALARILIRRPKILIMDEATNGLDADTEELVIKSIKKYIEESSSILIVTSHKEALQRICNKTIVLEHVS